jgi:DNA-binding beta-propeller fold protein YncE
MRRLGYVALALAAAGACVARASPADCNAPARSPSLVIPLPTSPFSVAPTADGCWLFVSGTGNGGGKPGVIVLKREGGNIHQTGMVPLQSGATGMTLSHDGKLLVVAATQFIDFLDVEALISGKGKALLGSIADSDAGDIYANITSDDKVLFVSEESLAAIKVIDLPKARANGFQASAVIGRIPVGIAPIALTFSQDGKRLFTTSELAAPAWGWPAACKPEGRGGDGPIRNPEGAVVVIDVARAATDPANSVVARVPAGCSPVRMAQSPAGDRIYVTARNSNAVLAFDTAKLVSDPEHARLSSAPVGTAPVPVAVIDGGLRVVAGDSDRFNGGNTPQSLTVLDVEKDGTLRTAGLIPAGSFPREMAVSNDGRTLFLTNFRSKSLQVVDLANLPLERK